MAHAALGLARMRQEEWAPAVASFRSFLKYAPPTHKNVRAVRQALAKCEARLRAQEAAGKR